MIDSARRERLRYLELKTNSRAAWGNYFDMESRMFQSVCQRKSDLAEFDPTCVPPSTISAMCSRSSRCIQPGKRTDEVCIGLYDHHICLDGLKGSKVASVMTSVQHVSQCHDSIARSLEGSHVWSMTLGSGSNLNSES
jgi:hypothetical protein